MMSSVGEKGAHNHIVTQDLSCLTVGGGGCEEGNLITLWKLNSLEVMWSFVSLRKILTSASQRKKLFKNVILVYLR